MKEKLKKKKQERQRTLIKIMLQFLFDRFLDLKKMAEMMLKLNVKYKCEI